jgi:hypothetical protein
VCLGLVCLSAAHGQQYTIQTLTGNGSAGFVGDGGDPAAAQLSSPQSVALDSKGNLCIADTGNQRIRMISASSGTITTIAGTGTLGYSGDKGAATSATFSSPSGLAFDSSDNLYIADTSNNVIRKITGTTITTIAGDNGVGPGMAAMGSGDISESRWSHCLALDAQGNLHRGQRKQPDPQVDAKTNIITTYVGGTGARSALPEN